MDPSMMLFSAILMQLSTTGVYVVYDYLSNAYFRGLKNDTERYINGELWWWEVKDENMDVLKRIDECNKLVANPEHPAIKSILCIVQSWKLKMRMDATVVAKDAMTFFATHKDFILFLFSFVMALSVLKRAYERQKKTDDMAEVDACSYKSPHTFKKMDIDQSIVEKDLAKEIMSDLKVKMYRRKDRITKKKVPNSFYKTSQPIISKY